MECKSCGSMLSRSENYCPVCGEKVIQDNTVRENNDEFFNTYGTHRKELPKVDNFKLEDMPSIKYNVYAIIGFVLSIISIFVCFGPIAGLFFILPALLLSLFGLKAYNKKHFAFVGLVISIITLIVNIAFTIRFFNLLNS